MGLLAASQAVTLVALRPKPLAAVVPVSPAPVVVPVPEPVLPPSPQRSDVWMAVSGPDVLDAPSPPSTAQFVQADPPLTVRSGLRLD